MADNSLIFAIGAELSNLQRGIAESKKLLASLEGAADGINSQLERTGKQMSELGGTMASVGSTLSATVTAPLLGIAAASLKVAGDLEQAKIGFTTLIGSAGAAQSHLDELRKFAASTPFEFKDLVTASQRMQALGFNAKEVVPMLTSIGNASAALGVGSAGIDRMVTALGQMQAKGKVSAEEMMQLAEVGVPAWSLLAEAVSKAEGRFVSIPEAMKMAEKGAISSSLAIQGIVDGMQSKFGGLMEQQSKTLLGTWSNFQDQVQSILAGIGEAITPAARSMMGAFMEAGKEVQKFLEDFKQLPPAAQSATVGIAAFAAAIGPAMFAFGKFTEMAGSMVSTIAKLTGTSGMPALTTGMTALATAIVAVGAAMTAVELVKFGGAVSDLFGEVGKLVNSITNAPGAFKALATAISENVKKLGDFLGITKQLENVKIDFRGWKDIFFAPGVIERTTEAIRGMVTQLSLMNSTAGELGPKIQQNIANINKATLNQIEADAAASAQALRKTITDRETAHAESVKRMQEAEAQVNKAFSSLNLEQPRKELAEMEKAIAFLLKTGQVQKGSTQYEQAMENIRLKAIEVRDLTLNIDDEMAKAFSVPDTFPALIKAHTDLVVEASKISLATAEYEKFNKKMSEVEATMASAKDWPKDIEILAGNMIEAAEASAKLESGAKALGITLQKDIRAGVDAAQKAFEDIRTSGLAAPEDIAKAWDAYNVKVIEANKAAGIAITAEDEKFLSDARKRLDTHQKGTTDSWDVMAKQVSTIMTDLGKDIAGTLTDMLVNWDFSAKGIVSMFTDVGKALVRIFVEQAFTDILKGLKDMDFSLIKFGESITKLFSGIAKTIGGFFGAGGDIAGSIPKGGGGAGAGTGGSAPVGSPTNVFGMITGAVDAITGVLGYLQGRRMEQDIGRIEVTSREIKAEVENIRKDAWEQFNQMYGRIAEFWQSMMERLDAIIQAFNSGPISDLPKKIDQIPDAIEDSTDDIKESIESGTDATATLTDAVTATAYKTQGAIGDSTEAITKSVEQSATQINQAQLENWRAIASAINNPEYAKGLQKAQMDVFGELYQWNKTYSPESLQRYAEMVKALQEQLGIAETTKGALLEIGFASKSTANTLQLTAPLTQSTATSTDRTAKATEATASNIIQLGVGLGNVIGGVGVNIKNNLDNVVIGIRAASDGPLTRIQTATESTVTAVNQTTQTLATGLTALGSALSSTIRTAPSAPTQIPFTSTPSLTPTNPIGGSDRPSGSTATTTTPTATTPTTAGGDRPVTRTQGALPVVTTADTAKILAGSTIFAQYANPTSWSPFNYQNPTPLPQPSQNFPTMSFDDSIKAMNDAAANAAARASVQSDLRAQMEQLLKRVHEYESFTEGDQFGSLLKTLQAMNEEFTTTILDSETATTRAEELATLSERLTAGGRKIVDGILADVTDDLDKLSAAKYGTKTYANIVDDLNALAATLSDLQDVTSSKGFQQEFALAQQSIIEAIMKREDMNRSDSIDAAMEMMAKLQSEMFVDIRRAMATNPETKTFQTRLAELIDMQKEFTDISTTLPTQELQDQMSVMRATLAKSIEELRMAAVNSVSDALKTASQANGETNDIISLNDTLKAASPALKTAAYGGPTIPTDIPTDITNAMNGYPTGNYKYLVIKVEADTNDDVRIANTIRRFLEDNSAVLA